MVKIVFYAVAAMFIFTTSVPAQGMSKDKDCKDVESANISLSFSDTNVDASKLSESFAQKKQEVIDIGKNIDATIIVDDYSYQANSKPGDDCFQGDFKYSGSFKITVEPMSKSVEALNAYMKQGYRSSLKVNSNKVCK